MSSTISITVSGLRADATEEEVASAFRAHGYIKQVVLGQPTEEAPNEKAAVVFFETRTALEAVGEALAAFGKEEPHMCASTERGFLTVRLAPDQPDAMSAPPAPAAAPAPQPMAPPAQYDAGYGVPPPLAPPPQAQQYDAYGQPTGYAPYNPYGAPAGGGYAPPYGSYAPPTYSSSGGGGGGNTPRSGEAITGAEVKLFVGGLPSTCTDIELQALMSPYGAVTEIHMMKPSEVTQQRCAFVTFEHHVSALAATKMGGVHRMNPYDRPIVVRFADSQGKRQRT